MQLQGNNKPLCIKDPIGDIIAEGKTSLLQCLYDGAVLTAEYQQKWTLYILHQGRSQSLTVEMSPVWHYIIGVSHCEYTYIGFYREAAVSRSEEKGQRWRRTEVNHGHKRAEQLHG